MDDSYQIIIRGCCARDRHSQQTLYNVFANKMMGVCLWYARNREEAEEILQDGFLRVFKYIHTFKGKGSFEGWIRRIMVNAALYNYRSKSHMIPLTEYNAQVHDITDNTSMIDMLEARDLMKMVQKLSPVYRLVFNLHVLEGMKHKEIALLLGITEGTSKSNLADARRALQKLINGQAKMDQVQNQAI